MLILFFFDIFWNTVKLNPFFREITSVESARRYWSWIQLAAIPSFFGGGTPNLYFPNYEYDRKFLNFFEFPHGISYDYTPLKRLLTQSVKFPIKTSPKQPRLLLVSVDLKDCSSAVTFDSYNNVGKICEICKKYNEFKEKNNEFKDNIELIEHLKNKHGIIGDKNLRVWYSVYDGGEIEENKHVVFHDGINLEQLTASCLIAQSIDHPTMLDVKSNEIRVFWDGGFLSNTPVRELLHHHRKYWMDYFDLKKDDENDNDSKNYDYLERHSKRVPSLEIYVVNLYPAIEEGSKIPSDKDEILDRANDIRFHDRTGYDIKSATMVSNYIDLTHSLIDCIFKMGKEDKTKVLEKLNNEIFMKKTNNSHHRLGGKRQFKDLLIGRFDIKDIKYIERKDDPETISGKHGDFSDKSIRESLKKGKEDAQNCVYQKLNKQ